MAPEIEENTGGGAGQPDNKNEGPKIDCEAVAEKVYRMMKADLTFERERAIRYGERR